MQITLEYMILIPVLIIQLFLFPLTVGWIMEGWVDARQDLALKETAGMLGSSIQQIYYSLNHSSIMNCNLTNRLGIPPFIEGYAYSGNATLRTVIDSELESTKILDVTLKFRLFDRSTTTSIALGQNVQWQESKLISNSTQASLIAEKYENGTIKLYFGIRDSD